MLKRIAFGSALATLLVVLAAFAANGQDWPQWRGANRDGVWREKGLIEKFAGPEIEARWRVPIANGYSAPTVANGRVYITDRVADKLQERVHCLDWRNGKTIWSYSYKAAYGGVGYPNGPRAAVTVDKGRAYSLGAIGHLHCFNAVTGKVLWSHDLDKEYNIRVPDWGITAAPLVEGDLLIVQIGGAGNACVVAFDKKTGEERWRALEDRASYSAPIVIKQAGKRVVVVWTADRVVGLNPADGKTYWAVDFPARRWPIGIATPIVNGNSLFITSAIDGALMIRLATDRPAAEKVWARRGQNPLVTQAVQSLISTPLWIGEQIYGIDQGGELRCIDAKTGDRLWSSEKVMPLAKYATAHLVRNGDRVWIFNERGELIIARLSAKGYQEISRAKLLEPTRGQLNERGGVCWAHPAYAYKHVFARSDNELVCASLKR